MIIDVATDCAEHARALSEAGVRTVIRYYARETTIPAKRLTRSEGLALQAAGLDLAVVHEGKIGNVLAGFTLATGLADGAYARQYGHETIGQPGTSAIYFAVDFDPGPDEVKSAILPYFQGVAQAMAAASSAPAYTIGVYGSGAVCAAVLDAGHARLAWLAQSKGWRGYDAFAASNRWVLQQEQTARVGGLECDPNQAAAGGDFGGFRI